MHLINVKTSKLEEFYSSYIPPYAILSHTWGPDSEELNFRDIEDGNINKPGLGSIKFRECCQQAAKDSLSYAWIDTCCIDKANMVELSEAINSMFRWYQGAAICYVFLSDVPHNENPTEESSRFRKSRWFQRGWTLQELLAPKILRFYSITALSDACSAQNVANDNVIPEWRLLGTKGSMSTTIASITGIPREYLLGIAPLQNSSIAQRMSWAAYRETKRKEDLAYCLLGMFNITIPMIYGEGDQAFFRLQEQIMKVIKDDSILAWGLSDEPSANKTGKATAGRIIAKAPSDFANSGHIIRRDETSKRTRSIDISGGSIRAYLPLHVTSTGQIVGLLSCGPKNNAQQVVGIPLIELSAAGSPDEYVRPQGYRSSLYSAASPATTPRQIQIKHNSQESDSVDPGGPYFHYEDKDFTDINLRMIDVVPRSCWDEERALIISTASTNDALHQILIRLRNNGPESKDFIIVLKYEQQNSETLAESLVFICSRNILLEELAIHLPSMMGKLNGKIQAKNEFLSLRVTLERVERGPIFDIRPEPVLDEMFTTIDAAAELEEKTLIYESLRLLDENEAAERESKELEDKVTHHNDNLKKLKKEQEEILAKIKALEDRQKALSKEEKECAEKRSVTTSRQAEVEKKLRGTSAQWVHAQKRWNELRHVDDSIDTLSGKTALRWAAAKGLIEVVRRRLDEGADVNAADKDGWTPLHAASEYGHVEVARLLIEKGAVTTPAPTESRFTTPQAIHKDMLEFTEESGLSRFYPEGSSLVDSASGNASKLRNNKENKLKKDVQSISGLNLYQPVIYCDDSSSMRVGTRFDEQNAIVRRVTQLSTRLLPRSSGISLQFINYNHAYDNLSHEAVMEVMKSMHPSGSANIGTNLERKILKPLVYDVINSQKRIKRTILVYCITSGYPTGEPAETFTEAILKCIRFLKKNGYPRSNLKEVLYCIPERPDEKFKELRDYEELIEPLAKIVEAIKW
ncbi:hypothetical protein ACHAQJ_002081 [Trichoderma viride]